MAYGDRRVSKLPSQFGMSDYFGLACAGALGIIAAIFMDMRQSADASALFVMNKWMAFLGDLMGFGELPLYSVVLILMAVGALSIFYFQPVSFQGAFAQGFGVLASLMTLAPSDLGAPLDAPMDDIAPQAVIEEASLAHPHSGSLHAVAWLGTAGGQTAKGVIEQAVFGQVHKPVLQPAAYTTAVVTQEPAPAVNGYDLTIEITLPNGVKRDVDDLIRTGALRGRLYNESTAKSFNMFRNGGAEMESSGDTIIIRTLVPGHSATATLWARVEVAGYAIAVESFDAEQGRNGTWRIAMTPSRTPLFIQRLGQSYWF